ncbi:MAG: T9SS type A sorting domain-containing protein, partial [Cytophagales bacterium]|nr:T9SS type A sorting domain-containing protein [Cytophagales bacterium]
IDSVVVTVNSLPIANAGTDASICIGSGTTLSASGGVSYNWSPTIGLSNPNIFDPVASPTSTTTYTVTVTDANSCVNIDSVVVTVNSLPVANAGTDVSICTGAGTTLSASGGVSYNWSPTTGLSNPNIFDPVASPTSTTTYTVTVTDANSCVNIDSVIVTVNSLPAANAGTDASICIGSGTTLSASGGVSYNWSPTTGLSDPNIFNPVASPTSTTTYTVTVTDANGCVDSDSVVVTLYPVIIISSEIPADVTTCGGSNGTITIIASGGTGTLSYSIDGGSTYPNTTGVFTNLSTGFYDVAVQDTNLCTQLGSTLIINEPSSISINSELPTDVTGCNSDSNATITINATGGTGTLIYSIDGGATYPNNTGLFTGLSAGSYNIAVQDSIGCTAIGSTLIINEPLILSISSEGTTDVTGCNGDSTGTITITANGGTGTLNYSIDGGATYPDSTGSFIGLSAGNYDIAVQDSNGCTAIGSTVMINEPAAISINSEVPTNVTTCGGSDGTITITASGGTGTLEYSVDNGITFPNTTGIFTGLTVGNYNVVVQDSNSCTVIGSTVTVNEPSTAIITSEVAMDITCNGLTDGTITIMATGGTGVLNYSIDGGTTFLNTTGIFTGLGAGSYNIAVQDSIGCTTAGSILIIFEPAATVLTTFSLPDTSSGSVGIAWVTVSGGTPPYSYLWDAAAGSQNTDTATSLSAGTYTVVVADSNGCIDSAVVTVSEVTGISNLQFSTFNFQVYPNPNNGNFEIMIEGLNETVELSMTDMLGKVVFFGVLNNENGVIKSTINTKYLPGGMYFVKITSSNNRHALIKKVTIY